MIAGATAIIDTENKMADITLFLALRVGGTIEFFEIIFKFVCFFKEKSCHSNSATTFLLDHVRPNGFECHIDQARNFPFRLSDDR